MTLELFYDGILENAKGKESFAENGWNSRRSQYRRFAIASADLGVRSNDSVLDIGCGNADLFWYLHNIGVDVNYKGLDIVPKMVEIAKTNLNGHPRTSVSLGDFVDNPDYEHESMFDHIICIGTVGAIVGNSVERWEYVSELVKQGLATAHSGMAITFLTDRDGKKVDDGYHWFVSLGTAMEVMSKIVPQNVGMSVRADYHPHDVMFILKHNTF
jgi:cyclopropane fatty-acyl-phospholipid synthase-like methyltransferase